MRTIGSWSAIVTLAVTTAGALGCNSATKYGRCVGAFQEDRRDPNLVYELSTWNVFLGIAGVPLIFPPILVLHHETYCPTAHRQQTGEPKTNALGETTLK